MRKRADSGTREGEILDFVIESYIKAPKPISSRYLCSTYHLPYSSATVRNILYALEQKGFLSHVHTSSGRVPTQEGFKYYVAHIAQEDSEGEDDYPLEESLSSTGGLQEIFEHTLDALAQMSGYTSLVAISGDNEKFFFRGTRFMLEQPEFEDIVRLKHLFYLLEVKIGGLQDLLFHCIDNRVRILVGDDIGVQEISDCSLVTSGSNEDPLPFCIGLLGPMRMDYSRAVSCLGTAKKQLAKTLVDYDDKT